MKNEELAAVCDAYLTLGFLAYELHQEDRSLPDYKAMSQEYYGKVARAAAALREIIPPEVLLEIEE